jgi:hypothetical protein
MTRGRSTDYTKEELLHFLNIALSIKPISQEAWEMVLAEHNVEFGHKNRTVESLRRKYAQLHRKKIPTGDPECPEEVKLAKRVKYAICTAADIGDGEEHMNIFDGGLSGTVSGDGNEDFETDDDGNVDIEVPNDNSSNANGSIGTAVTGNGSGGSVNDNSSAAVTTAAPRLVTTDASFNTVSIGNGGSVDCATPSTNQSTGRSRLVVTPRNRSPTMNIAMLPSTTPTLNKVAIVKVTSYHVLRIIMYYVKFTVTPTFCLYLIQVSHNVIAGISNGSIIGEVSTFSRSFGNERGEYLVHSDILNLMVV